MAHDGSAAATTTPRNKEQEFTEHLQKVRELASELSPISPDLVRAAPTWRAAYSDRTAALMAALCQIAYDRFDDRVVGRVEREAMELRLARGGFRLINTYDPNACTQAYLAISEQFAVLAFRGTTDYADWKVNLDAAQRPINADNPKVLVHEGFLGAYNVVHQQILDDLKVHVRPSLGLYITGHSLGGALAQIASAALARDNLAACYTFGSPRVGQADFDEQVKCPHYRLVNNSDLVPAVPPPGFAGYLHSGDGRWLRNLGRVPSRHGRPIPMEIWWALRAFLLYAVTRKLPIIDDHMIWNYKDKLMALADIRVPLLDCEPIGEPEAKARLVAAVLSTVRRHEKVLLPSTETRLLTMAEAAATRIAQLPNKDGGRIEAVVKGEVEFTRLVEEMIDSQLSRGVTKEPLDDADLDLALVTVGGFPPYWAA